MSRALSPTTSASSFFSADSELTVMAERDAFGQSGVFQHDPSQLQGTGSRLLEEHDSGNGMNFTQGSDECEATQPVWSQTQEATQPSSSGSSASKSKQKKPPLSEACWALLVPAAPNIGLSVWECRRDHPLAYRIGRNANRSEFHLPSRKISSLHAKLWMQPSYGSPLAPGDKVQDEGSVMLEDCSSNGVYVEGIKVGKGNKTALVSGNEVSFGPPSTEIHEDYRYIFRTTPKNQAEVDHNAAGGLYAFYDVRDQIGKGSFATVKRAIERSSGQWKAVKIMQKKRFLNNTKTWNMLQREVEIIKALDHPNITRYNNYFEDADNIYIVMEFVNGGDLLDYTIKNEGIGEHDASEIARQMCEAVAYLHSRGVCHRDLKPDNVLLTNGENPIVKISDFGLAKMVDNLTFLRTACGTPTYLAPEVVLHQDSFRGYSFSVDAWSIGVIVYAILCNSTPFEDDEAVPLNQRMARRHPDMSALDEVHVSPEGKDFIARLLRMNPRERMTVSDALNHPWLDNAKRNQLSSGSISLLPKNNALPNGVIKPVSLVYTSTSAQTSPSDQSFGEHGTREYSQRLEQLSIDPETMSRRTENAPLQQAQNATSQLQSTQMSYQTAQNEGEAQNEGDSMLLEPDSQPAPKPAAFPSADTSMAAGSGSIPFGPTVPTAQETMPHMMTLDSLVANIGRSEPLRAGAGSKRKDPASRFSSDSDLSDVSEGHTELDISRSPSKATATTPKADQSNGPDHFSLARSPNGEPAHKRSKSQSASTPLRQSVRLRTRTTGK